MSSETKSETTIPPQTPEEKALMSEVTDTYLPAELEQLGYHVTKTSSTFEESDRSKQLNSKLTDLQTQLTNLEKNPPSNGNQPGRMGAAGGQTPNQAQAMQLQNQIDQTNKQFDDAKTNFKPNITYNSTPVANDSVRAVAEQYGYDSQQYKDAQSQAIKEKGVTEQKNQDLQTSLLDSAQAIFSGDLSLKGGYQDFFNQVMGPYKEAATNAINYLKTSADKMDASVGDAIGKFTDQVQKTGMDMSTAVGVLENRVRQTGEDMNTALDNEIDITKQLNTMQITDFTNQQRAAISQKAAALGRSPQDPGFQNDLQTMVDRTIAESNLSLGQFAAGQKVGIANQTGQGLQQAAQQRIGIAQGVGQGMEQGAQMGVQNAQNMGNIRMGIAGQEGSTEENLAQTGANLRMNLATLPLNAMGAGINTSGFINSLRQQGISNAAAAVQAPLSVYGTQRQNEYAQPTTTTTTSMGAGGIIGGILGAGAGVVGGLASGGYL